VAAKPAQFSKGDWIVHLHYGVGQVKAVEKKQIGESKFSYYRVETSNSTFWVPVEYPDSERVRPVASKYKMRKAIGILRGTPVALADDHNDRKRQINEVLALISIDAGVTLLRDLSARQASFKLNPTEEKALDQFVNNFILEWSVSTGTDIEKTREKFQGLLQEIRANAIEHFEHS